MIPKDFHMSIDDLYYCYITPDGEQHKTNEIINDKESELIRTNMEVNYDNKFSEDI